MSLVVINGTSVLLGRLYRSDGSFHELHLSKTGVGTRFRSLFHDVFSFLIFSFLLVFLFPEIYAFVTFLRFVLVFIHVVVVVLSFSFLNLLECFYSLWWLRIFISSCFDGGNFEENPPNSAEKSLAVATLIQSFQNGRGHKPGVLPVTGGAYN